MSVYCSVVLFINETVCLFHLHRKLHCTRNFIHMNLFVSFILRAISVFIKDGVLYAKEDSEHCFMHTVSSTNTPAHMPTMLSLLMLTGRRWFVQTFTTILTTVTFVLVSLSLLTLKLECRAVMIFFHYCVLSNYFWLFIEGLYLFTLLVETFFPEKRYFYWYIIIGWGETDTTSHTRFLIWSNGYNSQWRHHLNTFCIMFFYVCVIYCCNRSPHSVCDHLGSAEATLW